MFKLRTLSLIILIGVQAISKSQSKEYSFDSTALASGQINQVNSKGHKVGYWVIVNPNDPSLIASAGLYENDLKVGLWRSYHPSKKIKTLGGYNDGRPSGPYFKYYPNGKREELGMWKGGPVGEFIRFYENGVIAQRQFFSTDYKITGISTYYWRNGMLQLMYYTNNGIQDGCLFRFDTLGTMTTNLYFNDGVKIDSANTSRIEYISLLEFANAEILNFKVKEGFEKARADLIVNALENEKKQTEFLHQLALKENQNKLLESERAAEKEKITFLNRLKELNESKIANAEKNLLLEKELATISRKQKQADSLRFEIENNALTEKNELNANVIKNQEELLSSEKRVKRIQFIFIITASILLIFSSSLLIFNIRSKRQIAHQKKLIEIQHSDTLDKNTRIALQHQLLEQTHKEITDSINYAERLQRSLMSSKKLLDENLGNYFVYFNPKEAVSGDFYWSTELPDKKFVLVCADSTGHGVPGAIMSMMNMNSLKEAVKEGQTRSDEILNHTRRTIIQTLANDGSAEGGKDGMDAVLLIFNHDKTELEFSLANNPLWIIRTGELLEFKADKMPVGRHDKQDTLFARNTEKLHKGDLIYVFTDGFADQFGGEKGKKFKYAALKDLLLSVAEKPMEEQKLILSKTFENWRGNLEQVDDVCVVGVRV
jgi:serine phosphatase RsbU (regulator of sigma subunit)